MLTKFTDFLFMHVAVPLAKAQGQTGHMLVHKTLDGGGFLHIRATFDPEKDGRLMWLLHQVYAEETARYGDVAILTAPPETVFRVRVEDMVQPLKEWNAAIDHAPPIGVQTNKPSVVWGVPAVMGAEAERIIAATQAEAHDRFMRTDNVYAQLFRNLEKARRAKKKHSVHELAVKARFDELTESGC